ncbi:MAG: precorrin-6Y C5,15-methyltransferase (decarboxylating) subunit CbiT [Methanobrevibacter sp.]|jgi:cobalt-precorrin-6B (C15)-methyltransferase|nr:precorrin-6Y C5,15-methyltransferase (decarboxylating) subunit CbiT [Candidatus Methanoflexus mossambicus]
MEKDSEFIKNENVPGPTKEEIRCLVVCKSKVSKNDDVVDIGCGTGGITVEMAKRAKNLIAIDKSPKAIETTLKNLKKFKLEDKVKLIENDALNALKNINSIDIAIIGGSGNDLEEIIETIDKKINKNGRIIVTAILLETKVQAISKLKKLGYTTEFIEVNIAKGQNIQRGTIIFGQNPIAIITAVK